MGGGDLNLKKSWHPSTLRNIERVWKAEQKHEAEQKKIEQLQRELADERAREEIRQYAEDKGVVKKKGDRLDWMYQGPAALVDREQYLTGRTVDKTFEVLQQLENKSQPEESPLTQPGAIFAQTACNVTVDLANKIREDPLFSIRKQETNQKKQLLNNPVKMKQLRELLAQSLETKTKSKKKKNKKDKKRRKHSESSSDDESSARSRKHDRKSRSHKTDNISYDRIPNKCEERGGKGREDSPKRPQLYANGKQYGLIGGHKKNPLETERSIKPVSRSPVKKEKSPVREKQKYKPSDSNSRHSKDHKRDYLPSKRNHDTEEPRKKKKLDPEEAERRCREMMQDAKKWHEQREKNIKRYQEEDDRRDGKTDASKDAHEFIRPMLSKAATTGTVEARIKQKMYNIQRNTSAMDKNFARR